MADGNAEDCLTSNVGENPGNAPNIQTMLRGKRHKDRVDINRRVKMTEVDSKALFITSMRVVLARR